VSSWVDTATSEPGGGTYAGEHWRYHRMCYCRQPSMGMDGSSEREKDKEQERKHAGSPLHEKTESPQPLKMHVRRYVVSATTENAMG
jgi:hypothetical protein